MTPPTVPRRFWPSRWSSALRNRLQLVRLLTLLLALPGFAGSLLAFGFADTAPLPRAAIVASMVLLAALWIHGWRREHIALRWLPAEMVLLTAFLTGVNPAFHPFDALYLALQHRAMYGTRRDATVVAFGYGGVFLTVKIFAHDPLLAAPLAVLLQMAVGGFGAYVMHTLYEVLSRDEERARRLQGSEERYRVMFQNSPWPMWLFDPSTLRFVEVNASAERHYGYSRDEFLKMTLADIRPPEDREQVAEVAAEIGDDERFNRMVRHRLRDGTIIDVDITAHPVDLEGRRLRLAVAVDVTARERVARELRESESRFRNVADCLREALLITDVNDRIILANQRVRTVLGLDPASVIGRTATDLLLPPGQRNEFRDRLRRRLDGESELYEVELVRGDGSTIVAEVSASPYRDANGAVIGTLGSISDVTDRRRLEERVRQSSRLEAVGQLAGGVAHDFNNLLTVVKCHAELLRSDLPSGDPLQGNVVEIERAANRAAEVTQQLLAFSRKQLMQPRRVPLDAVVSEALPVLRQLAGTGVEIATSSDGTSPYVFADPTHLENVLVTLVRNAREAMPRGGRITIGTESRRLEAREISFQGQHLPEGHYSLLTVSDTGAGMDAAVQKRLFEPFFTTKEVGAGSGLGLAGVFGIVRQSGGYVDVRSAPNRGSTFSIYLPSSSVPAGATPVLV